MSELRRKMYAHFIDLQRLVSPHVPIAILVPPHW